MKGTQAKATMTQDKYALIIIIINVYAKYITIHKWKLLLICYYLQYFT